MVQMKPKRDNGVLKKIRHSLSLEEQIKKTPQTTTKNATGDYKTWQPKGEK
jgi:hypothetical protein